MKIAICKNNRFNFSNKAFEMLIERGWILSGCDEYGCCNNPEAQIYERTIDVFRDKHSVFDKYRFVNDLDVRANPDVIQIIEELEAEASGYFANLIVVEVPDDVNWYIESDREDGFNEWIAEKHRTWGMD